MKPHRHPLLEAFSSFGKGTPLTCHFMGRGLELTHHFSLMFTVPAAGLQTLGSGIREAAAREIKLASGTHTGK